VIDGQLVIDAAVHGFNFRPDNARAPFVTEVTRFLHAFTMDTLNPQGDPRYRLDFETFCTSFDHQPRLIEETLFAESPVDVAIYHGVPMYGLYGDGSSPLWVGEAVAARFPHRMFLYADISPHHPEPEAWIDLVAGKSNVIGLKFYPLDMVDGRIAAVDMASDAVMALVARARDRGIRTVAMHKAVPLGPIGRDRYGVGDLAPLFAAFPDMRFEIVHGGFAFAEETARLLAGHDNVWINLETNPCFALNFADRFADMMEPLLRTGKAERLLFATGATGMHPRPFVEAFAAWRPPRSYCPVDAAMIAGMLGANAAALHGWDVAALKAACAADIHGIGDAFQPPWSVLCAAGAGA
jgi:uncharacterized protein